MQANMDGYDAALVSALSARGLRISAAESCTGGLFTALLTDVPGASAVLEESIVTYSNEAKMRELGVPREILDSVGAVSYETAKAMAEGIRRHTGADIGIGITGIAGPDGGTPEKPVGTVYGAVADQNGTAVLHMLWEGSRAKVRESTCRRIFEETLRRVENGGEESG